MNLEDIIKELIEEQGLYFKEMSRSIYTTCPSCGKSDKLSILKENGATICYRGSCDFGKGWFQDWLSQTAGISIQEAKKKIYNTEDSFTDQIHLNLGGKKQTHETYTAIEWPQRGFLEISDPEALEGLAYLKRRGISAGVAKYYDIRYSPWFRRVILPIKINGIVCGWQARAIDKVDDADRMRNNKGFRRDLLLMFQDELKHHRSALLFEGPFDALKFHSLGGIICSMGKHVSDKQLEVINNSDVESVYLGLDRDASEELRALTSRIEKKIKILSIPDSCINRCESEGKKADFGECTVEEARESFYNAKDLSQGHIFINLKKFF